METRICTKCGTGKPIAEFWFNEKKQRHAPWCRSCQAQQRETWKTANRERARENDRLWRQNNPEKIKASQAAWQARNPGRATERAREWYAINRESVRTHERKRYHKIKEAVYEAYGNQCNCCGETVRAFLSIDHVNNDGNERRRKLKYGVGREGGGLKVYQTIIDEKFPATYQILCMNCNFGKARNNGVCPHETVKAQRPFREEVGASAPKRTDLHFITLEELGYI